MSHPDTEALAEQVLDELDPAEIVAKLDPGQVIDNKVILSRRQLLAIAGSGLGAGALAALGVDEASAQTGPAGQVGTSSEPVDVFAWDLDVQGSANYNGNDLTNVGALDAESLDISGIGWVELDANSPLTASNVTSTAYTVDGTYDAVKFVPRRENSGFDQVRVNGLTDSSYAQNDSTGTRTANQTQWNLGAGTWKFDAIIISTFPGAGRMSIRTAPAGSNSVLENGEYTSTAGTTIDTVTFKSSGGTAQSLDADVFGGIRL